MNELEQEHVEWFWSDWFHHAAEVLAVMYVQRGRESGDSVAVWLQRVTASDGEMVRKIEEIISRRP